MKKTFAMVLVFVFCISGLVYATEYKEYSISTELPNGWTSEIKESSDIYVDKYKDEDCIVILSETSTQASTNAQLLTDSFQLTDMHVIRVRMAIKSPQGDFKRIYINNGTEKKELFVIKDGVLTIDDKKTELASDVFFDLDVAIDANKNKVYYWIDSEYIDEATIDFTEYAGESVNLLFWNGFINKKASSVWYISKFERLEDPKFDVKSNPENDSTYIDVMSLEKIVLDFDTIIPGLTEKDIKIETGDINDTIYSEIGIILSGNDRHLEIKTVDGFEKLKRYRVTVPIGKDIFNVDHTDAYILEFTTAPSGYVAPQCIISSEYDGGNVIQGRTIDFSVDITAGSSNITKAEIYRNNELINTVSGTYNFASKVAKGENVFYIKLYDEEGGCVKSNTVSVMGDENMPPAIVSEFSDGGMVSQDRKYIFTATDEDGTVENIRIRLDGKIIVDSEGNTAEWYVLSSVELGEHSLEIVATDNYGLTRKETYKIIVENHSYTEKIKADFSGFSETITDKTKEISSGITANPDALANPGHYIKNGYIDEEHGNCVMFGSTEKSKSSSAWLGIQEFSDASRPSVIAVFETNVYLSSLHTMADIRASNIQGNSCAILTFYKNEIQYLNGSQVIRKAAEPGKWYDIRVELNLIDSTYSLVINGQKLAENYKTSNTLSGGLRHIRMVFYNYENEPAYWATSKFIVSESIPFPTITGVGFIKEEADTDCNNADTFVFNLSSKIDGEKIVAKDFKLYAENKEILFNSYEIKDSDVYVKLKYPVQQNCSYKGLLTYSMKETEYKTAYVFDSDIDSVGFDDYEYVIEDDRISLKADIKSREATSAILIIARFKDEVLKEIKTNEVTFTAGENIVTSPALSYESNGDVVYRTYLWKGLGDRKSFSNKTPEFSNNYN